MTETKSNKSSQAQEEERILDIWIKENTFQKSIDNRLGAKTFSFYDGPPFANGMPHFGHSLVTSIKDSIGRYKTMRGYHVERRNGWDCHGLPVEFAVEKQFGISGKRQILELGLDKFNASCRNSVFQYKSEWEQFFERIGRWTDIDHAYASMDRNYTESVWWVLKQIHDKGLLYKGFKSMPYCPRCETPLSNFEVNEGYKDNVFDPSLYIKFKLIDEDASLLGWTTTPWSLPGNAAIAINPKEQYVYVSYLTDEGNKDVVILAKKRLSILDEQDYKIVKEISGRELVGINYQPLFRIDAVNEYDGHENLYKVWPANFVSVDDGTGVLHVAPAFGEDDLSLGIKNNIPVLQTIDDTGKVTSNTGYDEINGMFFKKADKYIIEHLAKQGAVFSAETIEHTYPYCYRCDCPLLYYAINTWFIKVSAIKDDMLKTAELINWSPEHIKSGRFGKWLEGARDWAISRNRYWGAPMPIWVNINDPNDYIVMGSIEELKDHAGSNIDVSDLHRPMVDEIGFTKDGKTYKRIDEVLDCWFESGSMPVAQHHYPFENTEVFKKSFPADYIGEGLDQTRLWFYVQHVISTILFNKPAYKNVLVNGMIMAADGQKLSKRLKNYPPLNEVFDLEGADTLRLYLLSNNQAMSGDYMRFNRDAMKDLNRNVIGTLLNSYRFFKMYTEIDNWTPSKTLAEPKSNNLLDKWIIARLNQTTTVVTTQVDDYQLARAISPIFELIDDLSNWFIRRSRRRFWKSEDDSDKQQAYATLHYCLANICQLLAPWAPFTADSIWRDLVAKTDNKLSVHLADWPSANSVDEGLISNMIIAREVIVEGLSQRAVAKIKVRQPLQSVKLHLANKLSDELATIIADELNVKEVLFANRGEKVVLSTTITESLRLEGLMRDIVRHVQEARKKSGLHVSDRINLNISSKDQLISKAITAYQAVIYAETLAQDVKVGEDAFNSIVSINEKELNIKMQKRAV